MFRVIPLSIIAATAFLTGCTTTELAITPVPTEIVGENPDAFTVEKTHRVTVELMSEKFSRKFEELPTFAVEVENQGEESVLFGTNNVVLTSGSQPVSAYTFDEYVKLVYEATQREADEYGARQAEVTLGSQIGHSGESINDNSQAIAKISAANRTNDAAAIREAASRIGNEGKELINFHQINPGSSLEGLVKFHGEKIQANEPLKLVVTLNGEPYEFEFKVNEVE